MNRLTLTFTPEEMNAIRNAANANLRHPRNEVKFLVLKSLGMIETTNALEPVNQTGQVEPSLRTEQH